MDCIVHGVDKSRTRLSDFHLFIYCGFINIELTANSTITHAWMKFIKHTFSLKGT